MGSLRVVRRSKPRLSFLFVCLYEFVDARRGYIHDAVVEVKRIG